MAVQEWMEFWGQASPDGVVIQHACDLDSSLSDNGGLLEIKCPFKHRARSIMEAVQDEVDHKTVNPCD